MIEIYCTGCIYCHKVIKKLNTQNVDINIISDEKVVSKVVSNTFGVIPVFKYNEKYYNEYDIDRMLNEGIDFNKKIEEVIKVTSNKSKSNEEVK